MDVQKKTKAIFDQLEKIESKSRTGARKRLLSLFDQDSFIEIGAFVKQRPSEFGTGNDDEGVVAGYGTVNGLLVYAFAQEPSIKKGSISEMHAKKICNLIDLAVKSQAPVVSMIDSCGIKADEGVDVLNEYGELISYLSQLNGVCLHICVVFGTCSGALSFVAANADYTVIKSEGELFLSSPAVVDPMGEGKSGSAQSAFEKGLASSVFDTDEECIDQVKKVLDIFLDDKECDPDRLIPQINDILSNDEYDIKEIINLLADGEAIFFRDGFAKNVATAICRINGMTTGICANQPAVSKGDLDSDGAKKLSSFIVFCDSYDIPILTLVDSNGFSPDSKEDIFACAELIKAYNGSSVPMVTVALHKAYGAAYIAMCPKSLGADIYYALTTAEIASLPPEIGGVMFADEMIAKSDNPVMTREEAIRKYTEITASPVEAAKRGYIDNIVEPVTLRQLLISAFEALR